MNKVYFGIAVILLLVALFFLREGAAERDERETLGRYKHLHSLSMEVYLSAQKAGYSPTTIEGTKSQTKSTEALVDKQKQRVEELTSKRRFKMCVFLACSSVFFIAGVIQSSRKRT
jgi:hypothetical protein